MRKVVIKGYGYTTQQSWEVDRLAEYGTEIKTHLGENIDMYIDGADVVVEGDVRLIFEPCTKYYLRDAIATVTEEDCVKKVPRLQLDSPFAYCMEKIIGFEKNERMMKEDIWSLEQRIRKLEARLSQ